MGMLTGRQSSPITFYQPIGCSLEATSGKRFPGEIKFEISARLKAANYFVAIEHLLWTAFR